MKGKNRYLVKIPRNIAIIYSKVNNTLLLAGPYKKKSINIVADMKLNKASNSLTLLDYSGKNVSAAQRKRLKALRGTALANIKQAIVEINSNIFLKLKLVGVGFRAFEVEGHEKEIIMLRLGYSHSIFMSIPTNVKMFCLKLTKLFIFGSSYHSIFQYAADIKNKKKPEPYKGKGVLYENEKILLKEGKKK